jgi:NAD(P)-dependent dehydrogenase (short-subunit alcohol dehydrogenase family)
MRIGAPLVVGGIAAAALTASRLRRRTSIDLAGQVALITGGSRGLGYLLARELGREGCRIAICARDAVELERAREALAAERIEALTVVCDVGDPAQVERMVATVAARLGPVDLLVNNAGIIQVGPVEQMGVADFEQAMASMYWGVVYPTLAVLPGMRDRRAGRIVNITSIGGKVSVPHLLPYSSAKFAAVGFSEGLRAECARDGIRVTTVVPGLMRTGSHINALFKGERGREFTWFSLGASLPLISMDAERAARQIVAAARRGDAERVLSVPATLLTLFHGIAPGVTTNLLGAVDRFVLPPPPPEAVPSKAGRDVAREQPSRLRDALTTLGRTAADRNLERPAPSPIEAARR